MWSRTMLLTLLTEPVAIGPINVGSSWFVLLLKISDKKILSYLIFQNLCLTWRTNRCDTLPSHVWSKGFHQPRSLHELLTVVEPDTYRLVLVSQMLSVTCLIVVRLHSAGGGPKVVLCTAVGGQVGVVAAVLGHLGANLLWMNVLKYAIFSRLPWCSKIWWQHWHCCPTGRWGRCTQRTSPRTLQCFFFLTVEPMNLKTCLNCALHCWFHRSLEVCYRPGWSRWTYLWGIGSACWRWPHWPTLPDHCSAWRPLSMPSEGRLSRTTWSPSAAVRSKARRNLRVLNHMQLGQKHDLCCFFGGKGQCHRMEHLFLASRGKNLHFLHCHLIIIGVLSVCRPVRPSVRPSTHVSGTPWPILTKLLGITTGLRVMFSTSCLLPHFCFNKLVK